MAETVAAPTQLPFVTSYKNVKASIDLHERDTTSSFISQRSENKDIFTLETFPRGQTFGSKKIYWDKTLLDETSIAYDGVPFIIVGHEVFECHQGPKHGHKTKGQDSEVLDHAYEAKKKRYSIQNTKKMGCTASIKLTVIIKFPQYKHEGMVSDWTKRLISKEIKSLHESSLEMEPRFYIAFPAVEDHKQHLTGEFAGYCQPPAEKIRQKIAELAMLGIRKVSDVKVFLENYVSKEMFPGLAVSRNNRRYFPSNKDIRNHIYTTLQRTRFSLGDQENLEDMVNVWKTQRPTDSFFIRIANQHNNFDENSEVEDVVSIPPGFLFVHQTDWQKRLLALYGQELCLLDATYNTSKYDLPLFFLCVQTNVGYSICGTFISSNESTSCIAEGLSIIKSWNIDWMPENFLTDFDEREIAAIEDIFPGCSVYLCQFHREQAWDRWLREVKNGVAECKVEVLTKLRTIANSSTVEDYQVHLDELKTSSVYQNNSKLKAWLEKKWFPAYHRWVFAYRKHLVNIRLTTTNGLERKHRDLKYNYLKHYGDGTLSTMVSTLINRFLKESYDDYISYNVKCLDVCKKYSDNIPQFLQNRPKIFVEHCMSRLPPNSSTIYMENITEFSSNNFQVKSADSGFTYLVCLDQDGPSCQCMDWGKYHLPCKHMLAVFTNVDTWEWNLLPNVYRDCPHFNIDPIVADMSSASLPDMSVRHTTTESGEEEEVLSFEINELQEVLPSEGTTTTNFNCGKIITTCSNILKDIQNDVFKIDSEDSLNEILKDLTAVKNKAEKMIPLDAGLPLRQIAIQKKPKSKVRNVLPLRKKRRKKLSKLTINKKSKKQVEENVIVEGTCDIPEIISEHIMADTDNQGTSKFATNQKEDHIVKEKASLKLGIRNVSFKDPVAQVQQYETTVHLNRGNLELDVVGYRINNQSFEDLDTMLPDEVVNAYISLKCRNCKDKRVKFIPCEIMSSIFNDVIDSNDPFPIHAFLSEVELEEYEMLMGGLNEDRIHWTLMVILPETSQLLYLNPLGEPKRKQERYLQNWIMFLTERYNRGIGNAPTADWRVVVKRHRKQYDSNSCGVFVLKFADLILDNREELLFDSSARGLRALRHVIGQYITECSNNMQEVQIMHELAEPSEEVVDIMNGEEKNENYSKGEQIVEIVEMEEDTVEEERQEIVEIFEVEEGCNLSEEGNKSGDLRLDSDDELEEDEKLLTLQTFKNNYEELRKRLYQIMECDKINCNESHHQRHHDFMKSPLREYNRERQTHNFACDVTQSKTFNYLHSMLLKDLMYLHQDKKHPYSKRSRQIRKLKNEKLKQVFTLFPLLADTYLISVLVKEIILMVLMDVGKKSYQEADEICRKTEINVTAEVRKMKVNRNKNNL